MILNELFIYSSHSGAILKKYPFNRFGLNVILGEKSIFNEETNGVGKSTMVDCIEFLLGRTISQSYEQNPELISRSIFLILEIESNGTIMYLGRHLNIPKKGFIHVSEEISFEISEWESYSLKDYRDKISNLLSLNQNETSFSALREYIVRNEKSGFNDITLAGRKAIVNYSLLAFLFGLPHRFEYEIQNIKASIDSLRQQIKLIESIGIQVDKLKIKEEELETEVSQIKAALDSLEISDRVQINTDRYSKLKTELQVTQSKIFELEHVIKQYQKNINNLTEKTKDIKQLKDLEPFFEQLVGYFPFKVKQNYEEIETFYNFMVDNRGKYFNDKISVMQSEIVELKENRQKIEDKLRNVSQLLKNKKFVEDVASIIKELEDKQLELAQIKVRLAEYNNKNGINDKINKLEAEKLRLTSIKNDEFNTYNEHVEYLQNIFNSMCLKTYNQIGVLNFEFENSSKSTATTGRIKIRCTIPDEKSHGRLYMKINMFDLTWLLYRIENHLPINFLFHDGSYSKPDVAVKPKLLSYIDSELKTRERGQYFVTVNIDELEASDIEVLEDNNCVIAKLNRSNDGNRFFGFKF
ncbi:hypothetical protein J25TS5_20020 [Paenibacillus faecis]|uniref:DUF2326 domain-containing protein n=1 Tax=Paenibacillus faecis TaxID=862114 RepID=UPI001B0642D9|nr:DUF2326 domain-containing protein [Paenibacillus faecis]GIO85070.1 hypothetical protein J25TS5_20020 [Paenibacillus faecis]